MMLLRENLKITDRLLYKKQRWKRPEFKTSPRTPNFTNAYPKQGKRTSNGLPTTELC